MKRSVIFVLMFWCVISLWARDKQQNAGNTHRIMSYNIHAARGMDGQLDLERIASVINSCGPDIVALQEVDSVTRRGNKIDMMDKLSRYTMMYSGFASAIDHDGGKYGVGLLSRVKPLTIRAVRLPGEEERRVLLVAEFEDYVVFATHFSLNPLSRLESVKIIEQEASKYSKAIFLAGDLNADPGSETIKLLQKSWKGLNSEKQATYPSGKPEKVIDYIMGCTHHNQLYSVVETGVVDEKVASDHRPLYVDVRLKTDVEAIMRTVPYLQNPSAHGMTVMWHTNVSCNSWVEYGTDTTQMQRVRDIDEGISVVGTTARIRIGDLQPATKYYYRVCSQEVMLYRAYHKEFGDTARSEIFSFTTFDDENSDFTAVVLNDLHGTLSTVDLISQAIKDVNYDFLIYNGDCLPDMQSRNQVLNILDYYSRAFKGSSVPGLYIRGNHETRGAYSLHLWDVVAKMFGEVSYGSFSYGDTRFVVLDCGEDKPDDFWVYYGLNDFTRHRKDQLAFILKEVKSKTFKKAGKKVLIHHIPLFGKNQDRYNPCKDLWESGLAKGDFDVSLNAHTHSFEYVPEKKDQNNYPVVIGGGPRKEEATIMVLNRRNDVLKLDVLNLKGENLLSLEL